VSSDRAFRLALADSDLLDGLAAIGKQFVKRWASRTAAISPMRALVRIGRIDALDPPSPWRISWRRVVEGGVHRMANVRSRQSPSTAASASAISSE
jgi:hypothetical protein